MRIGYVHWNVRVMQKEDELVDVAIEGRRVQKVVTLVVSK